MKMSSEHLELVASNSCVSVCAIHQPINLPFSGVEMLESNFRCCHHSWNIRERTNIRDRVNIHKSRMGGGPILKRLELRLRIREKCEYFAEVE